LDFGVHSYFLKVRKSLQIIKILLSVFLDSFALILLEQMFDLGYFRRHSIKTKKRPEGKKPQENCIKRSTTKITNLFQQNMSSNCPQLLSETKNSVTKLEFR